MFISYKMHVLSVKSVTKHALIIYLHFIRVTKTYLVEKI